MKAKLFLLAALALVAAGCSKTDTNAPEAPATAVPVKLSLTLPADLQPAPGTRMGFEKTGELALKSFWKQDFEMLLILFQSNREDNADWRNKCVVHKFRLPPSVDGQKTLDLSSVVGDVDLSKFDSSKPLKYVVTSAVNWHSDKENLFGNAMYSAPVASDLSTQLERMIFATPVQKTAVPTAPGAYLYLEGNMEWLTSVLAVKFDIAPAASALKMKPATHLKLFFSSSKIGDGNTYPNSYDPVLRKAILLRGSYEVGIFIDNSEITLNDALDADGVRYYTIPADDGKGIKFSGSIINISAKYESRDITNLDIGRLNSSIDIQPGRCYGVKIKVEDANGDSVPEFRKE